MNLEERIQRGRVAIAQAKATGKDVGDWEKHLTRLELQARMAEIDQEATVKEVRESNTIQAIKICSHVLADEIWLILDRSFVPSDGLACYYAEEIPLLKDKTPEDLRQIHEAKLAFPGCRVIQEGAEPVNRGLDEQKDN